MQNEAFIATVTESSHIFEPRGVGGWKILDSYTRFRVSGGGYSVISKPVLTQKRGVVFFDWTFFTVMKLVACQITMELICNWLLVFGACFLKGN